VAEPLPVVSVVGVAGESEAVLNEISEGEPESDSEFVRHSSSWQAGQVGIHGAGGQPRGLRE
jgi:hypothetical protein